MRTTVATDTRLLGIGGVDWWRRRGSGGRRTGSLNSRERNAALGSLTTLVDGGRYANLISRKWTSCPLGSSVRACAATLMRGGEDGVARAAGSHKPILLRSHDRPAQNEPVIYVSPRRCLMISTKISDARPRWLGIRWQSPESSSRNWNSPSYRESWCY